MARALGKEYARVCLGGVRDEAQIRGHRRTYIGALPGDLTAALRQTKTSNPLILLDEIGGHELASDAFRQKLYQLLDSEFPCVGVIKSPANTKRMDDSLLALNDELHSHLTISKDFAETFERWQTLDCRSK